MNGGIGRKPGKRRSCKQKRVLVISLTSAKLKLKRELNETTEKSEGKHSNHIGNKTQIVNVTVRWLHLCLQSKEDERLIDKIVKETSRYNRILIQQKVSTEEKTKKVSDKLKNMTAELIIQKDEVNNCALELNNNQKSNDSLDRRITKGCKNQVKKVEDDTKRFTKGLHKRFTKHIEKVEYEKREDIML